MKIGILTQPLKNNYGGILQAYALQKILIDLGHEVWIINRVKKTSKLRKRLSILYRSILSLLTKKEEKIDRFIPNEKHIQILSNNAREFIKQNFSNITHEITNNRGMRILNKQKYDAFIVGSDQVWRLAYSPYILNYYLDFVNKSNIKRISYAASFGLDCWEYSEKLTKQCQYLIKKFNAVSVREQSAVDMCLTNLGVKVDCVLDPTMLLNIDQYIDIINKTGNIYDCEKSNNIFAYILDEEINKIRYVEEISKKLEKNITRITPLDNIRKKHIDNIENLVNPKIEDWLKNIYTSEFVITDSFHGCVFSILFNKPFIAIGNKNRGLTRFTSLLSLFNLEDRLTTNYELDIINNKIDWTQVNNILDTQKKQSLNFILNSLK